MGKLLTAWGYFTKRLAEPSTHASIASLVALAGYNLDSGVLHDSIVGAGVAFGLIGCFVKEQQS